MDISSRDYKRAFEAYLRYGTPLDLSLKQEPTTTHYIWRTRKDGKVRPEHAANEGKVFAWDNPPPTGHPGDDYGCRCTAEPYQAEIEEAFSIELHNVADRGPAWTSFDYSWHYFFGAGKDVTLRETGNLQKVVAEYRRIAIDEPKRLPGQIANKARKNIGKTFACSFGRPYPMRHIIFSLGDTTISGEIKGHCQEIDNLLLIAGEITFKLYDEFRDPLSIGAVLDHFGIHPLIDEIITGAIADGVRDTARIGAHIRAKIGDVIYRVLRGYIEDRIKQIEREFLLPRVPRLKKNTPISKYIIQKDLRELPLSQYYELLDQWRGTVTAKINVERLTSRFTE